MSVKVVNCLNVSNSSASEDRRCFALRFAQRLLKRLFCSLYDADESSLQSFRRILRAAGRNASEIRARLAGQSRLC